MRYTYRAVIGGSARRILSHDSELRVVAVHSESVYARCFDGRLLLVCPDKYGSVPFGVSVGEYASFRDAYEFSAGDVIKIKDEKLILPNGDCVCFDDESVNRRKHEQERAIPNANVVGYCAEYVRAHASLRGIGPALPAFLCIGTPREESNVYALSAAGEADRLEQAFAQKNVDMLDKAVGRFVGLGYGLTPSGDDFLCGMLYALHRSSCISDKAENYLGTLSAAVSKHMGATNEVSAEYIRCALDGEYFEVVERVLDCLSVNEIDVDELDSVLGRLLSVGASSGSDILCGMLFAAYLLW